MVRCAVYVLAPMVISCCGLVGGRTGVARAESVLDVLMSMCITSPIDAVDVVPLFMMAIPEPEDRAEYVVPADARGSPPAVRVLVPKTYSSCELPI